MAFFKVTTDTSNRIIGLDIIRALAVFLVVFYHSRIMLFSTVNVPYIGFVVAKIMSLSSPFGELGVEMFFVLSGYLIGTILIKEFTKNERVSFSNIKSFWVRRWFRTLPNYFFIFILNSILYLYLYNTSFDWKYLLFLQNFSQPHPDFFSEAWSLSIEEWSYLLIPLCIFMNIYFWRRSAKAKRRGIFTTVLLLILIFNVIRITNAFSPAYEDADLGLRKIVMFRLDAIAYGILVAYLSLYHSYFITKYKTQFLISGLLVIFTTTLLVHWGLDHVFDNLIQYQHIVFLRNAFLYTIIPISFALIIPFAAGVTDIKNKYFRSGISHISLISYSMYLTHFSLIGIPFFFNRNFGNCLSTFAMFILYWMVVVVVSTFMYKYYEKPLIRLREKFK